jgi:16S rRNA (cytidine1402-2'-O)-methyltransferase
MSADLICCEDTRRTRALLSAKSIPAGGPKGDRLVSLHGHNEATRVHQVLSCLASGGVVAVVSDAGTPGISDPGALLVARAVAAGEAVTVVPGPTSPVAALAVSGLPTDRFCMEGFLPRRGAERHRRVAALMSDERTTVVLEAPGRVAATLEELAAQDPGRRVAVVRELTKVHEEVWRGTVADGAAHYAAEAPRGEVVIVVDGASPAEPPTDAVVDAAVREHLARDATAGARRIADAVAHELGVSRRRAYETVLQHRTGGATTRNAGETGTPGGDPKRPLT